MSIVSQLSRSTADDGYARYYAEKLWEWIPEYYRDADLNAQRPHVLRTLIEVIGSDAATARRSIDRLWEDVLIDYADDWAVSYIGDLLGTRMLSSMNARGRRADVGRTLFYRRRSGTPVVVESLVKDITGWGGALCETFKRLHRHWHELDCIHNSGETGRYATPRHGFANLRAPRIAELTDSAFDQYAHYPDFRRHRGFRGRYSIPKLNLHLYRQLPVEVANGMGAQLAPQWFSFDPSGRDTALFSNNGRTPDAHWRPARIWDMPGPITRAQFNHAIFDLSRVADFSAFGPDLAASAGASIEGVLRLQRLAQPPGASAFRDLQKDTIVDDCGKAHHYPEDVLFESGGGLAGLTERTREEVMAGDLGHIDEAPGFTTGIRAIVDPERGRVKLRADSFFRPIRYHYGQFGHVGAGGYDRGGALRDDLDPITSVPGGVGPIDIPASDITWNDRFTTSRSYRLENSLAGFVDLVLQADNYERPYVALHDEGGREAVLAPDSSTLTPHADDPVNRRSIEIDGLWLSVDGAPPTMQSLGDPDGLPTPVESRIVIDGSDVPIALATLRHVTLDPGGERGRLRPCEAVPIPYVKLVIKGQVDRLVIDRSIVGMIEEDAAAEDPCSIGELVIRDSIVQSIDPALPAINLKSGHLVIERSTVFGNIDVARLDASELMADGRIRVVDVQNSCFRFSATQSGSDVRLPAPYESHFYENRLPRGLFVSRRFGDAGFAQLSRNAPAELVTGGENRSEIGVFNRVLSPLKMRDLRTKLDEFTPLNTVTQLVIET